VSISNRLGLIKAALAAALVVAVATSASAQVPGAPIGVSGQVNPNNSVTLSWAAPNGGAQVINYAVDAGTTSGSSNLAANVLVGNVLSVTGPPLPAGSYFVRVRAVGQFGPGPVSTEVSFTIGAVAVPGPPTNLVASVSGTTLTLTWGAPASGGAPLAYLIDAGTGPGGSNIAAGVNVGNILGASAGVPVGQYFIRVRAVNGLGAGLPSNEVVAQVGSTGPPGAPTNLDFTVLGGAVQLRWSAPATGGTPTGYNVEVGSDIGASNYGVVAVGNVTSVTNPSAPAGTYFVRVRATNAFGPSAPSNERIITATPNSCVGAFVATLTWDTGSVTGTPYQSDIDLHVREPGNVHVYYASRRGTTLLLDVDNTRAFGPENICTTTAPANGTYEVYVVAYSGNQWPSNARVTVRTNVGTPSEAFRVITRTFTTSNSGLAQNVATVTFPGGVITETSGTRSPLAPEDLVQFDLPKATTPKQ
jgi:hypothetical protein